MNESEGGESDLGEKKKISGEIKVKSSLHDHSEMSAPWKTHIEADRLERTHACAHTQSHKHITAMSDAHMHLGTNGRSQAETRSAVHTQTTQRAEVKQRPHVSEGPARSVEHRLYLCTLPFPTSHHRHTTGASSSSITPSATVPVSHSVKNT